MGGRALSWLVQGALIAVPLVLITAPTKFAIPLPKLVVLLSVAVVCLAWAGYRLLSQPDGVAVVNRGTASSAQLRNALLLLCSALIVRVLLQRSSYLSLWGETGRHIAALLYLSVAIIAITLLALRPQITAHRLHNLHLLVGLLTAGYAVLQMLALDPITWNLHGPISTFGNIDQSSSWFSIVAVSAGVGALQQERPRNQRILSAVLMVVSIWVVIVLYRRPWRVDQGGILLAVGLLALSVRFRAGGWLRKNPRFSIPVIVIAVGIAGYAVVKVLPTNGLQHRIWLWRTAYQMFASHPFVGVGLARYGALYQQFRMTGEVRQFGADSFSDDAHGVLAQMLATGGLLVTIPYVLVALAMLQAAVRTLARPVLEPASSKDAMALVCVLYWMQTGAAPEMTGLSIWGWCAGALVAREFSGALRVPERWHLAGVTSRVGAIPMASMRYLRLAAGVALVAVAIWVPVGVIWPQVAAEMKLVRMFRATNEPAVSAMRMRAEQQARRDTAEQVVLVRAGDNMAAYVLMDMLEKKGDPDGSRRIAEYTIEREPDNPVVRMELANLLVRRNHPELALPVVRRVNAEISTMPKHWILRSYAAAMTNDTVEARMSMTRAVELAHSLADSSANFRNNRDMLYKQYPYLKVAGEAVP